ncbi:MAG: aminodeoxychorismate/anthranilate synthase component II [Proteobacteria bacterium]|nr:aminodeoxychorismate/anthranilate synthase component II [Pseudomonadota bacterium]
MEVIHTVATLLVIDNYDSFTFNLVQMFRQYDLSVKVFRSDQLSVRQAGIIDPDYILISPGPKNPSHAGISIPIIKAFYTKIPVLGVCLGMQCINEAFGGITPRAPVPVHGKTSAVIHEGKGLFEGIPNPFTVARYHSLMIEPRAGQQDLVMNAFCDGNIIMGLQHRAYPLFGVQFHPESFLTEYGYNMIENFLKQGPLNHDFKSINHVTRTF